MRKIGYCSVAHNEDIFLDKHEPASRIIIARVHDDHQYEGLKFRR